LPDLNKEANIPLIIRKYIDGESNPDELQQAISILRRKEYDNKIRNVVEETWYGDQWTVAERDESGNLPSILREIHSRIAPELEQIRKVRRSRVLHLLPRIAAILVTGLFLGIAFSQLGRGETMTFSAVTPAGSISQLILPDSSLVFLNSGSTLNYTGLPRERKVLLEGEALFQVREDEKRPFVVHNGFYDVLVTGTEFNIKAYQDEQVIATTLVEGSVTIPATESFRLNSDMKLFPGQQMVFDRETHTVKTSWVNTRHYTSWKDNKLVFINMSLKELVVLLERKFGVNIEVSDPSILNYHYDGTLKNESILEILDLIKITLPIEYEVVGQTIFVTRKKP